METEHANGGYGVGERQGAECLPNGMSRGQVNTYIARVAHELTTPVSLISGSLENLEESLRMLTEYVEATQEMIGANDEAARLRQDLGVDYRLRNTPGLLQICSEGAQRLNHVVNQLRFYARRPGEATPAERSDVKRTLHDALAMALHGRARAPVVSLVVDDGPLTSSVPAEPLGQVLLNVVRNALDALGEIDAPQLELRAGVASDGTGSVYVAVKDNGLGIPEAYRSRIFDEFFTTKSAAVGLGLGLSITRDILRSHGGSIDLIGSDENGTEFRIVVPPAAGS